MADAGGIDAVARPDAGGADRGERRLRLDQSVAVLVAPALAGVLLGAGGASTVFVVMGAAVLVSALLVAPVARPTPLVREPAGGRVLDGLYVVAREPGPRALAWLLTIEGLANGALDVLYVVLAVGILGAGGGTGATVALVGRRRLAPALLAGLALWAVSLALIAAVASTAGAFALLAVAGVGRTLLDVSGRTLLQRIARPDALARVFGLLEGVTMTGLAVGSIAASGFVALAGNRGAFACFAVRLPLCALLVLRSVLSTDAMSLPVVELARLRALPIFAPLSAPVLEGLARSVEPVEASAGTEVVREGERGDRFYVVADGALDVTQQGRKVAALARGDCFGEIALLRDVPRTATVIARTEVMLDALDKVSFVAAVTGQDPSAQAADDLVRSRLERAPIPS
jgi:hypothetical protein